MMNLRSIRPSLPAIKMEAAYQKNFNLALINWELNRQEDQKRPPLKKERKVFR